MEILTASKRKSLRLRGMVDGLRRALTAISDADAISGHGMANCRAIIEKEIDEAERTIAALDNEF
jgi:hypothetical protein